MSTPNADKKTVILISSVFAAITAVMLLLIPLEIKNQRYEKWGRLAELAETNEQARFIIDNEELYPDKILNVFYSNNNELEYVYNYPFFKDNYKTMSFTEQELNSDTVPALYMNDYRWAYEDGGYVKGAGCAAVDITMANLYVNRNSDIDPVMVMRYADEMGYYGFGGINEENISDILDYFGIKFEEHIYNNGENGSPIAEAELKAFIDKSDTAVIVAVHGLPFGNHALIIRGYDENGFYINDPASEERTDQSWSFDIFEDALVRCWLVYPN